MVPLKIINSQFKLIDKNNFLTDNQKLSVAMVKPESTQIAQILVYCFKFKCKVLDFFICITDMILNLSKFHFFT